MNFLEAPVDKLALVQVMAWRQTGAKPSPKAMIILHMSSLGIPDDTTLPVNLQSDSNHEFARQEKKICNFFMD